MRHITFGAAVVAVSCIVALPAAGKAGEDGFYWGADLGISMAGDMSSTRTNIGVPTNCDQWLTPSTTLPDGRTVPLPLSDPYCGGGPRPLPAKAVDFSLDAGLFLGIHVGYQRGNLRFEAEYFRRGQEGEKRPLVVPGDDKQVEFTERSEEIGDVQGDNFFANVYYDWAVQSSKFKPYVGVGVGAMRLGIDYSAISTRNSDREALLQLNRNPNAAGTTSRADESLSDTVLGYQLVGGVNYALNETRSLNLKVRYGRAFGDFEDGDNPWASLRGHASTAGPNGAPIRYGIAVSQLSFWALSVGFKFDFR